MTIKRIPRWRFVLRFALNHEAMYLDRRINDAKHILKDNENALDDYEFDHYLMQCVRRDEIKVMLS